MFTAPKVHEFDSDFSELVIHITILRNTRSGEKRDNAESIQKNLLQDCSRFFCIDSALSRFSPDLVFRKIVICISVLSGPPSQMAK